MFVCRSNLSFQRFWEGRTELQRFSSKLTDVVILSLCLDCNNLMKVRNEMRKMMDKEAVERRQKAKKAQEKSAGASPQAAREQQYAAQLMANGPSDHKGGHGDRHDDQFEEEDGPRQPAPWLEILDRHCKFRHFLMHLASLLHGVALLTLRHDMRLSNIIVRFTYSCCSSTPKRRGAMSGHTGQPCAVMTQAHLDLLHAVWLSGAHLRVHGRSRSEGAAQAQEHSQTDVCMGQRRRLAAMQALHRNS
jgi:hypothetical protein